MLSEAQNFYLHEVLGVSPSQYAVLKQETPSTLGVAVVTGPLSAEESALLIKILASIQLRDFAVHESLPEGYPARHILNFGDDKIPGRHAEDGRILWNAPALAGMIGSGPAVTGNKKAAWNLLQQLAREIQ